jgi:hypothetical protein
MAIFDPGGLMSARSTRLAFVAVLAAFVFITVGCGGGSDGDDASGTSQTTHETNTGSGSDDSDLDSATGFFASADYRQLARAFDSSRLGRAFSSGVDPTEDLQTAADFLDEAADKAPEEISGDVQVVANAYDDLAEESADVDWPGIRSGNPAAIAGAAQLGQAFASPDLVDALQNLSTYVRENCTTG